MGQFFDKDSFTAFDHKEFRTRLQNQLGEMRSILECPGFSDGPASIGAELEMYLVDHHGTPVAKNAELINLMQHSQLTEELNQCNLEFNLSPVAAKGKPFYTMEQELLPLLNELQNKASEINTNIVPIGILPTLKSEHLQRSFMSDLPRYRALTNQLSASKGEPFLVDIHGQDTLKVSCEEVTLEGANTSFQIHLKVPADRFADMFNAAQLVTPLVLALSGNSPTLMGKRLWQETRIALFKQSIDNRIRSLTQWRQPARVSFGQGWVRRGAWELFAENVALYPPLLPYLFPEDKKFSELNLHHGTVWSWNRAIFEPNHGGHLRIEFRAFPAGPTVTDMMANAALVIGWTQALSSDIESYLVKMPFQYAEYNFYRAAQKGLDAEILWPRSLQHQPTEILAYDVIKSLLPLAAKGLRELNVDDEEIAKVMKVLEARLANKQTGSQWQLKTLQKYETSLSRDESLIKMLNDYMANMTLGHPVSTWS
jgi:gamma-glutamyl:cysteine ligase YbdK (ATP-grasp superfamily)